MMTPRFPDAGETLLGGRFFDAHGGKGSNQAVGAARLGAEVSLLTAVGTDRYGAGAAELWDGEGVDHAAVPSLDTSTMVGVIVVESTGENRIIIANGALDGLGVDHVEAFASSIAASDVLLVSLETPVDVAAAALATAHESGVTTILNPAPAVEIPDEIWAYVDIVTPNATEAQLLAGATGADGLDVASIIEALHSRSGATVVATLGGDGALICGSEGSQRVPAVEVADIKDTTGAGDAFNAALAVAIAGGLDLADAVRMATYAGAHAVTVEGVVPSLPTMEALAAMGYER